MGYTEMSRVNVTLGCFSYFMFTCNTSYCCTFKLMDLFGV